MLRLVSTDAAPLYNESASSKYEWVTLDIQDATHMPAYQWVVLKKNVTDKNKVSAVDLYNREYNDGTAADATLQLNKNAGATYMYAASLVTLWNLSQSLKKSILISMWVISI